MPITIQMTRSIAGAILTGLLTLTSLVSGADVRGTITIQRKLTPRNITPAAGLYQRGARVALQSDSNENALDYERSHVVVYLEGEQHALRPLRRRWNSRTAVFHRTWS